MKKLILLFTLFFACLTLYSQAQTFVIEGRVLDETGEPLSEATVYLKDRTGVGTSTSAEGKFGIKAARGDVIVISFVGYENIEFLVTEEKKDLEIQLKNVVALDEVIVVGLGSQRKISSVAAVTSVDVKDLQVPATSVANLLGGKVAGIISMQTSGEPGQNISEFWVRGIGTFGASQGALVLIDGLEGDINSIDAADIESFSILKDASATAVYGVRGANGVVLINTKKGIEGKLSISARANFSLAHLKRMPEYLRSYEYAQLVNEALAVRGDVPLYTPLELDIIRGGLDPDMYPDVSWQDEIVNSNSFNQSYYVSARGGGEVSRYFVSLGLSNESAAYKNDKNSVYSSNVGYNTYNYRTNLDMNLTKTTSIFFGTDGFLSIRNEPGIANTDYLWYAQSQINPLMFPVVYSNGMLPAAGSNESALSSPNVLINHTGKSLNQEYKGKVTLALSQDLSMILEGLKFKMQGAYDIQTSFTETRYIQPPLHRALGRNSDGVLIMKEMIQASKATYLKLTNQFRKYHFETTVTYDKLLGKDHRVSALVYYYISDHKYTKDSQTSMSAIPVRYQGLSSRLTYNFRDTYMIDVNFGYTGSENFQPGKQFGFFPSIAAGWVPSSYKFVKDNLKWVDFFKIRGSYGSVGNDRLAGDRRFPYITLVNTAPSTPIWGGSTSETVNETVIGADNLAWEKAIKSDIGIEGRFWNDKISLVVDFFQDMRDGIFQQRIQVPEYVGAITLPFGNVGKMKSYGSDGNISFTQELGKDMSFILRSNFTYSKNMVQNWEQMYEKYPYLERTGLPNDVTRGYQALGLFRNEDDIRHSPQQTFFGVVQPGDIKYKDVNGDGKINEDDMVPLSRSTYPMLMYGIGGEFRYKNITVGILFKGTGKTDFYHVGQIIKGANNGMGYIPFYEGESGNVLSIASDPRNRWIPMDYALANGIDPALAENPNARFPKLQYGNNKNNSQLSDFWKGDSRYLRLQEITVNYNFKQPVLKKIGISSIDLQLIGTNLHVWDKVKIFDPEQANRNGRVYPIPSVYTLQLYIHL
jgi:TonB-linked SusC/RagA family outer membrane protein